MSNDEFKQRMNQAARQLKKEIMERITPEEQAKFKAGLLEFGQALDSLGQSVRELMRATRQPTHKAPVDWQTEGF